MGNIRLEQEGYYNLKISLNYEKPASGIYFKSKFDKLNYI